MRFVNFYNKYHDGEVQVSRDVRYNLTDIINKVRRLRAGVFQDGLYPDGTEKYFYNIGWIMEQNLFKQSRVRSKNIDMFPLTEKSVAATPLIKAAVRQYLEDSKYDAVLENLEMDFIGEGHILTEEFDNETHKIELLNVIRPAHVMDFSSGFAHKKFKTVEFMESKTWLNQPEVNKIIALQDIEGGNLVTYDYLQYGEFKGKKTWFIETWLDNSLSKPEDDKENSSWDPWIKIQEFESPKTVKIFSKAKLKRFREKGMLGKNEDEMVIPPYKEKRLFERNGRWLGIGTYELLDFIIRDYNEQWNRKRRFDQLANSGVVVHKYNANGVYSLTQDIINNMDKGTVVSLDNAESLERLNMGSTQFDFIGQVNKLFELARQMMGIQAALLVEEQASTTATASRISNQTAKTTYRMIIDKFADYLSELFTDFKIKQILEDITEEDMVKIAGNKDDLETLMEPFVDQFVKEGLAEGVRRGVVEPGERGSIPQELIEQEKALLAPQVKEITTNLFPKVKKEWIKDFEFLVRFNVANEAMDTAEMITVLNQQIAQTVADPTSQHSADKMREYLFELLNIGGARFKKDEEEKQAAQQLLAQGETPTVAPTASNQPTI